MPGRKRRIFRAFAVVRQLAIGPAHLSEALPVCRMSVPLKNPLYAPSRRLLYPHLVAARAERGCARPWRSPFGGRAEPGPP